jgi:hypothetical protein
VSGDSEPAIPHLPNLEFLDISTNTYIHCLENMRKQMFSKLQAKFPSLIQASIEGIEPFIPSLFEKGTADVMKSFQCRADVLKRRFQASHSSEDLNEERDLKKQRFDI